MAKAKTSSAGGAKFYGGTKGYNPYRNHGKFAAGPHKAKPKPKGSGRAPGKAIGGSGAKAPPRKVAAKPPHHAESAKLAQKAKKHLQASVALKAQMAKVKAQAAKAPKGKRDAHRKKFEQLAERRKIEQAHAAHARAKRTELDAAHRVDKAQDKHQAAQAKTADLGHKSELAAARAKQFPTATNKRSAEVAKRRHEQAVAQEKRSGSAFEKHAVAHGKAVERTLGAEAKNKARGGDNNKDAAKKGPAKKDAPRPPERRKELLWHDALKMTEHAARGDLHALNHELDGYLGKTLGLSSSAKHGHEPDRGHVVAVKNQELPTADGVRYWSGRVELRETVAANIKAFGEGISGEKVSSIVRGIDDQHKAGVIDQSGAESRKRRLEGATDGMRVMVHEALHGFSPVSTAAYARHGAKIEEVTTEVGARVVMNKLFDAPIRPSSVGAYAREIHATVSAIAEVGKMSHADAYQRLQAIALDYKRATHRYEHENAAFIAFAGVIGAHLGVHPGEVAPVLRNHYYKSDQP